MSEIDAGRRRILDLEARLAAEKAAMAGEIEVYRPVGSIGDPRELEAEVQREIQQREAAEQNFLKLKTRLAKITTPYNKLFEDMAFQEHVKQNPRPKKLFSKHFSVKIATKKDTSVLEYHLKKEGEDSIFVPDSYVYNFTEDMEEKSLSIDFVDGEISDIIFVYPRPVERFLTPRGDYYIIGHGDMPAFGDVSVFDSSRRSPCVYSPDDDLFLSPDYKKREITSKYLNGLTEALGYVPRKMG